MNSNENNRTGSGVKFAFIAGGLLLLLLVFVGGAYLQARKEEGSPEITYKALIASLQKEDETKITALCTPRGLEYLKRMAVAETRGTWNAMGNYLAGKKGLWPWDVPNSDQNRWGIGYGRWGKLRAKFAKTACDLSFVRTSEGWKLDKIAINYQNEMANMP